MIAVYAIVGGNAAGWVSARTLGLLAVAAALMVGFIVIESRIAQPLVPLALFKLRNLAISNVVGVLWAAAMFAWFFFAAPYQQQVLGCSPLQVGLAFLPTSVVMAFCSLRLSDRLVMRFGVRPPLVVGLALATASLMLFGRAPVGGSFVADVLPSMLLLGAGAGIAFNPVLLAAMGDVEPHESGLASGVVNTSFMMGGALGLAVFVSLADWHTASLLAAGESQVAAMNGGFQLAFLAGGVSAALAALGALALGRCGIRRGRRDPVHRARTRVTQASQRDSTGAVDCLVTSRGVITTSSVSSVPCPASTIRTSSSAAALPISTPD